MAPLTNAPFAAVVEDTNGSATDGATPVPVEKIKINIIIKNISTRDETLLCTRTSIY